MSTSETAQDVAARVIKKYPNRRLYDTETSSYITLSQIRELVMAAQPLVVRDAKTGEDLTRSILLQIILEEEAGGVPLFSEATLAHIVRFQGHAMQSHLGQFMEQQMQAFVDWQSRLGEQAKTLSPELWARFMQAQAPLLQQLWGGFMQAGPQGLAQNLGQAQEQMQAQWLSLWGLKPSEPSPP